MRTFKKQVRPLMMDSHIRGCCSHIMYPLHVTHSHVQWLKGTVSRIPLSFICPEFYTPLNSSCCREKLRVMHVNGWTKCFAELFTTSLIGCSEVVRSPKHTGHTARQHRGTAEGILPFLLTLYTCDFRFNCVS